MTIAAFIRENKDEIDAAIQRVLTRPNDKGERLPPRPLTNKDRHEWILNDEGLYRWAQASGVRI